MMFLAGVLFWTLFEYGFHRLVLHRLPMHAFHHRVPDSYFAIDGWMVAALCVICCMACMVSGLLSLGLIAGFITYSALHASIHLTGWPKGLAGRHAIHHADGAINFGVTTSLWDRLFKTC